MNCPLCQRSLDAITSTELLRAASIMQHIEQRMGAAT